MGTKVKVICVTVFFVTFTLIRINAQILVGPVVGGQMGWYSFGEKASKDLYTTKIKPGYHVGASISFRVQKKFFLQGSVLYSQRNKIINSRLDSILSNEAKFKYLDLPILYAVEFKGKLKNSKEFKWYVAAGPVINYWIGGEGVLNHSDLNENFINPPSYDLPYHVTFGKDPGDVALGEMNIQNPNRVQLGLNFSVGFILEPVGFEKIMATLRYELGSSYLSSDDVGDFGINELFYQDDLKVRSQAIYLSLSYFIDLKIEDRKRGKSTVKDKRTKKR